MINTGSKNNIFPLRANLIRAAGFSAPIPVSRGIRLTEAQKRNTAEICINLMKGELVIFFIPVARGIRLDEAQKTKYRRNMY